MNIQNYPQNSPLFTSRLNPIKPSTIKTKWGKLTISEATKSEYSQKGFAEKLSRFFSNNFASNTDDPCWLIYNDKSQKNIKSLMIKTFANNIQSILKNDDGNMTLLLAKDKYNKIQGACLSYGYNLTDNCQKYTLYIDSICVNKPFRGFKLGNIMLNKTLNASEKSKFTDVFLTGEKKAAGFYTKNGFSELNPTDKNQKKVINLIAEDRSDYPQYIQLFSKPLKPEQPRWYDKAAQEIPEDY